MTLMFVGSCNRELGYVATPRGAGVSVVRLDAATGHAEVLSAFGAVDNPTYLALSPDGTTLAAVSELDGTAEGRVNTFGLDGQRPVFLGAQSSMGYTPAHVSFDGTGRFAAAINYGAVPVTHAPGASVVVYPVSAAGGLGAPVGSVTHSGSGPNAARQDRPHAHCVHWTPDNRFVVVADLGIDRVLVYGFEPASGKLSPHGELALPPGSGPRHITFHPGRPLAYVVSELSSSIASLAFDAASGSFQLLAIESTLPPGTSDGHCSALRIAPGGHHLLAGNRGPNTIARFDIGDDGIARLATATPCGGKTPRDFAFDPSGQVLAVANQDSDAIALFRFDRTTGALTPLATPIAMGSPTCVAFLAGAD